MYKEIWETIKSGKTWTGRIKNKNKDGEAYWVDSTISPFYDINGEHVGYFSYRIDVTQEVLNEKIQKEHYEELKITNEKLSIHQEELESQYEELLHAQEKLEKSSQEFIKLFDEAPNVYVMMDKDFKLITYNKKAIKFFNFSMLNSSSQYFPMFIEKDFREDFFEFISLKKYKKEESLDISIEKNRFKMIVDTHPTNKDWYFVTLIDIEKEFELLTTLEATSELLNREYERFNLAIEGSQTGLFDWNLESNSIYFSPKWKELVGYKDYELDNLLETWEDLVNEEDLVKVKQIIQDYLDNPIDVYEATFRMKHKDGNWVWINARGKASLNKDGKPNRMIGFHKDITELIEYKNSLEEKVKKQLEEIRDKDLKMLDQAKMASLGEMMNNIAHQWRQPLNVISISGSSMKYCYEFGGIEKDEMILYIEDIMKSCEYLTKTIETFSKFLSKNKNVEFNSIEKEISSTKYIIESSLKSNLIKLIDEIDYEKEHKCFMVENELSQVILNIISNAEYALNENKTIEDDKWIKITSKEDNDYFTIMIEDNAGGIPMEIISNIFEPYFTTKFQSQGTGLGLSMSYSIIKESIKGDIYVKNTENGAKFYLEIPLNSQLVHTD